MTPITDKLSTLLASMYTLQLATQYAHWNITGPQFHSLHVLFQEQYEELFEAVDTIAELIRTQRAFTPGSMAQYQKMSFLGEFTTVAPVPSANEMLQKLHDDHEAIITYLREELISMGLPVDVEDMLTERIETHEKAAWMLRSSIG